MTYKPDSAVMYIVVHYSATPIERDYTAADIDNMHRARGFKEIGYHYFIRKNGMVEKGRDMSQPGRFEQGAHSSGENDESIGICYEGGVKASRPNVGFDSRTPQQKDAMEALILSLLDRFLNAIVKGHRDMPGAATQCPGFDAGAWWDSVVASREYEASLPFPEPAKPVVDCPHTMALIEEADGAGSKTDQGGLVNQVISGGGIVGILSNFNDLSASMDWRVLVALIAAGVIIFAVSTYTRQSRKRKADKALLARMEMER